MINGDLWRRVVEHQGRKESKRGASLSAFASWNEGSGRTSRWRGVKGCLNTSSRLTGCTGAGTAGLKASTAGLADSSKEMDQEQLAGFAFCVCGGVMYIDSCIWFTCWHAC